MRSLTACGTCEHRLVGTINVSMSLVDLSQGIQDQSGSLPRMLLPPAAIRCDCLQTRGLGPSISAISACTAFYTSAPGAYSKMYLQLDGQGLSRSRFRSARHASQTCKDDSCKDNLQRSVFVTSAAPVQVHGLTQHIRSQIHFTSTKTSLVQPPTTLDYS